MNTISEYIFSSDNCKEKYNPLDFGFFGGG